MDILLLETGDALLLETGGTDNLILQDVGAAPNHGAAVHHFLQQMGAR